MHGISQLKSWWWMSRLSIYGQWPSFTTDAYNHLSKKLKFKLLGKTILKVPCCTHTVMKVLVSLPTSCPSNEISEINDPCVIFLKATNHENNNIFPELSIEFVKSLKNITHQPRFKESKDGILLQTVLYVFIPAFRPIIKQFVEFNNEFIITHITLPINHTFYNTLSAIVDYYNKATLLTHVFNMYDAKLLSPKTQAVSRDCLFTTSPLIHSAITGNVELCKSLLELGADICTKETSPFSFQCTALHWIVTTGTYKHLSSMISDNHPAWNEPNALGLTPKDYLLQN